MAAPSYEIRSLTTEELNAGNLLEEATALINDSFVFAEEGLWKPGWQRTSKAQVEEWSNAGELHLAINTSSVDHQTVIGVVRVHPLPTDPSMASFGPLAVAPTLRKAGMGKRLIEFTEAIAASKGFTVMQLELLVPPPPRTSARKENLKSYYSRMGYSYTGVIPGSQIIPEHMMKHLVTEDTMFYIMQKQLLAGDA